MNRNYKPRPAESDDPRGLPLTLPVEVWQTLEPAQKAVCRCAQAIHDLFPRGKSLHISDVLVRTGLPLAVVMPALEVLNGMDLLAVDAGPEGPELSLVATPDAHVRVTGPDGKPAWVFVSRPFEPPSLEYSQLN